MGLLAGLLPREGRALRRVRDGNVRPATSRAEAGEEARRVGRRTMGRTPQRQSILEGHGFELVIGEDVDVRGPSDGAIRTARREPVVVPGRHIDRDPDLGKGGPQELEGIGPNAIQLEKVASRQDRVAPFDGGELQDAGQCLASIASPQPCPLQ